MKKSEQSKMVRGQISRISTTADQCIRLTVDIPTEIAPADLIKWLYSTVELVKIDE